jgi:hypothetical protein
MQPPNTDFPEATVEALARELWEAHGAQHEQLTRLPAPPFETLDAWMQAHWRMLARVALAWMASSPPLRSGGGGP